jgi:hypothetical protein
VWSADPGSVRPQQGGVAVSRLLRRGSNGHGSSEPPERRCTGQRPDQRLRAVRGAERKKHLELGGQPGVTDRRGVDEGSIHTVAERAERLLDCRAFSSAAKTTNRQRE